MLTHRNVCTHAVAAALRAGQWLAVAGRHDEALKATEEAVAIYKTLAEAKRIKDRIEAKLGRPVVLSESVRPALLGGMVLEHEDFRWNWSLSHHLRQVAPDLPQYAE